ncbi:hypothetical protein BSL78_07286 [Apostichopus japonicus]|uniref:EGF-like domain-containing protein n=1 Tax=Stichopus japonicus TaxID=307972 RepID=A0A2G8L6D1_STIJA|nr:hypothetical protein BSL78_07286 [Apostichopus japonicus]
MAQILSLVLLYAIVNLNIAVAGSTSTYPTSTSDIRAMTSSPTLTLSVTDTFSPCDPNRCQRGGSCFPLNETDFLCLCPLGVQGRFCDQVLQTSTQPDTFSPCDPNQCQRGGSCIPLNETEFLCLCPLGVQGRFCDQVLQTSTQPDTFSPCDPNRCQRGGSCIPLNEIEFLCLCPLGVQGRFCDQVLQNLNTTSYISFLLVLYLLLQIRLVLVRSKPVSTRWLVFPSERTDFLCLCPLGVQGRFCDQVLQTSTQPDTFSPCDPNRCQRGGSCIPLNETDFLCLCPLGVQGRFCDQVLQTSTQPDTFSPCDPNRCQRGGSCIPLNETDFLCLCPLGVQGRFCDQVLQTSTQPDTLVLAIQTGANEEARVSL